MHEIRLTYEADLPARSGLGTSSSFAVGMLNAFYALKGKYADKKKLADEAIYLERNLCQEAGGWQDQIAASFGGFNRINFNADGYEVLPVIISPERKKQLNQNLMMFFTGFTRFSSDVQKANAAGKQDKTAQLKEMLALGEYCTIIGTTCLGSKNGGNGPSIGNHCELGMNSVVIGNVRIGDNVYIGAGAVVTKSFEQNEISLVGVPAKVVVHKN